MKDFFSFNNSCLSLNNSCLKNSGDLFYNSYFYFYYCFNLNFSLAVKLPLGGRFF